MAAVAGEMDGDPGADPVGAPVDHCDRPADLRLAGKHVPCLDDRQLAGDLDAWRVRDSACRDDHGVGRLRLRRAPDRRACCGGRAPRRVPSSRSRLVTSPPNSMRSGRRARAAPGRRAGAGFVERNLVAALRSDGRRLHAGRPAAGDEHPLAPRRALHDAVKELTAGDRVLDAGDRQALVEMPDAGLIAGDAGADVVERAPPSSCAACRDRRSAPASCRSSRPGRRRAIDSASCGWLMRPVTKTGIEIRLFSGRRKGRGDSRSGTPSAARCGPRRRARRRCRRSRGSSRARRRERDRSRQRLAGLERPCSSFSSPEMRRPTTKSASVLARMSATTSCRNRSRFSGAPP